MWRLLGGLPVDSDDDSPDSSSPDSDDSEEEEDSSNSSAVASRPIPVVDLASPSTAVRRPLAATAADDDDDDVQILTAEEAAATVAAAAERGDAASRKRKRKRVETKAEPTECTICCEDCTIVGRHRLVALRCGHLFGKKCIEHWLSEKRTCPNCNSAVKRTDICPLFSDHVAVVDNSGVEEMKRKFDEEKKRSAKLEKEVAEVMKQLQLKAEQAMKLQDGTVAQYDMRKPAAAM
ncbi:hypothetical protein PHYBOEH_001884 [Phytophthora boehmeriae]|uniref:RING-type domain-containing protein n=1 Tax=Phytophthora boehmeriae TaxID=109152 RepID=A0A8T1WTD1_9STRA|nr:hypothetical protein PHYBOEH_001884 [Phytophthora boehmeriae]